ncbi:hypothetical protein Pla110_28870 [Polystyrenella longa]|uniref:Uncharacterized protein n=1 Tax=Polystyrenella longa TaxID=2528007 RepID=A0A518CPK2_9PLAN|nr:hypothetical protein [Polystyrenella longa]QDU81150.1 hypothetical protein Pla110_28870 [Polystyrenella longa]
MLKITPDAWNRLVEIQSTRPDLKAVRLRIVNGLLKCHKGRQKDGDQVIVVRDRPTILMSPQVAESLQDCSLDVHRTDQGARLRLKKFTDF